ncbi:RNA-binding cell elongation regulator Jag/EloR [Limosilactobacillus ingluviei]|uniref:RNA-binding cell elongation regulator Jag/EloR n=1 Tax=Limosilactobacillus ingluviei TaxID=148604 RepID=UPI0002EA9706|nr:RNA-binding cell elongation regulator Jag/EloR [Limosilactobacillus ingluviei]
MATFEGKTLGAAKQAAAQALGCSVAELTVTIKQMPTKGFFGWGARLAVIEAQRRPKPVLAPTPAQVAAQPTQSAMPQAKQAAPATRPGATAALSSAELAARQAANLAKMTAANLALQTYLVDVCHQLALEVQPQVQTQTGHELSIDLVTPTPGKLIGYHGRRLNALEVLATTFLVYQGVKDPQVTLDVADYRARRQVALAKLAQRSVTEVIATQQAVFLAPMPARERKFLHQYLETEPQVKTYSHGREPYRSLVIAPK